jgi:hypothetical protein
LFVQAARFGHRGNIRRVFLQLPVHFARTAFCILRDGGGALQLQILWDEMVGWFSGLHYMLRPWWLARSVPAPAGESRP